MGHGGPYTSVSIYGDLLIAGTKNGSLDIYNASSLSYTNTITFFNNLRENLLAGNDKLAEVNIGPSVLDIIIKGNGL